MPISQTERQVKFAAADSIAVAALAAVTSDLIVPAVNELKTALTIKSKNSGVPAAGDTIDVYLLKTSGDPDADPDVADEYSSLNQREMLCQLDTNNDDPDIAHVEFSTTGVTGWKIYAVSNAAVNSITLSASGQGVVFS